MAKDPGIHEQLEYYRARSSEYDQWWYREGRYDRGATENAHWFRDAAEVVSALTRFGPSGRILELACGTGIWSEKLLPYASELTLIDGSREMLNLAERRLKVGEVHYVEADLFEWQPKEEYDTVFFSFWHSHVPPTRFSEFWSLVSDCLAPGGCGRRICVLENIYRHEGSPGHEVVFVFEVGFSNPSAYATERYAFLDHGAANEVFWRKTSELGGNVEPLFPDGLRQYL